jgi:DNA-binding transcriptional ArsR family regulator
VQRGRSGTEENEVDVDESISTERDYLDLKRTLRALGDVVRLHIVEILGRQGEMTVTDLTQKLVVGGRLVSQPLVSWHLTMLRRAALVQTRRTGRLVYCTLDRECYQASLRMLSELVAGPAQALSRQPVPPGVGLASSPADTTGART